MKIFYNTLRDENGKRIPVILNSMEAAMAQVVQLQANPVCNALGIEVDITTLTTIMKRVTEQKFFEIAPASYMPVRVGNGAWSSNLLTYRSFVSGDDFSTGILNTGGNDGQLAAVKAGVDAVPVKVYNWGKTLAWTLMDLNIAAKAGNWDLVTTLEGARKKNWDLGIQKVAFLGLPGDSRCLGLYNLTGSGVQINLTVIPQPIKNMAPTDLKDFCAKVLDAYRTNCARTCMPSKFIVPESDFLGLASASSPDFPIKSVKDLIEETFKTMTGNDKFQVLPCAYGDAAYNKSVLNSGSGLQRYILTVDDETSLRVDIPVDYTTTLANSINNFTFQNVGYGQFTGVGVYRPLETLYFDHSL